MKTIKNLILIGMLLVPVSIFSQKYEKAIAENCSLVISAKNEYAKHNATKREKLSESPKEKLNVVVLEPKTMCIDLDSIRYDANKFAQKDMEKEYEQWLAESKN